MELIPSLQDIPGIPVFIRMILTEIARAFERLPKIGRLLRARKCAKKNIHRACFILRSRDFWLYLGEAEVELLGA